MIKINGKECNCDEEVLKYVIKSNEEKEALEVKYTQVLEVAQDRFERIQKAIEYISKHNCIATYEEYKPTEYEYCCSADLLDILKGGDNNGRYTTNK